MQSAFSICLRLIEADLVGVLAGRDDKLFAGQPAIDLVKPAAGAAGTGRKDFGDEQRLSNRLSLVPGR